MGKEELVRKLADLKNSFVRFLVEQRLKEFKDLRRRDSLHWFLELCFCILTANSSAKLGMKIQSELGEKLATLSLEDLRSELKRLGHRFYNKRAEYIVDARKFLNVKEIVMSFESEHQAREWLVKNIKGLGYKEASHFLRNVGFDDVAIIDRHILRALHKHGLLAHVPTSLSRKKYLAIEEILRDIARSAGLKLSALDLYLWYMETGEVLK